MDPQQRCVLEEAAALAQPDVAAGQLTAVAVGIAKLGEPALVSGASAAATAAGSSFVGTGRALSAAAGRLSFVFGLKGASVAVDTACSSSLVALHFVWGALGTGDPRGSGASAGLACGVNLPMNWETSAMFAAAGMMASDGRCKTLDAGANGYVRSEACVVVRVEAATAFSRGSVLAAVGAVAINQDGRSSSLTAPHGPSQQTVIAAAATAAGLPASDLAAVEMHGTGTALGDPIEVRSRGVGAGQRQLPLGEEQLLDEDAAGPVVDAVALADEGLAEPAQQVCLAAAGVAEDEDVLPPPEELTVA